MRAKNNLYTMPAQALRSVFEVAQQNVHPVFWMRSVDYQKQIYVSPAFAAIWKIAVDQLYQTPSLFNQFLVKEDASSVKRIVAERLYHPEEPQAIFNQFRIINNEGKLCMITDCAFPIYEKSGRLMAIAGIGGEQLAKANTSPITERIEHIFSEVDDALEQLKLYVDQLSDSADQPKVLPNRAYVIDGCAVTLSPRQAECLNESLLGLTAKQIGQRTQISYRTVEEHLDIVRRKIKARNKLELIHKFSQVLNSV